MGGGGGGGGLLRTLAEQPTISYGTYRTRFFSFFCHAHCTLLVEYTTSQTTELCRVENKNMAMSVNGLAPPKKPRKSPQNLVTVVLGSQWGDEGKGKIVDMISATADICCRCQVSLFPCFIRILEVIALFEFFPFLLNNEKRVSFFVFPKALVRFKLNLDRPSNIKHFLVYFVF